MPYVRRQSRFSRNRRVPSVVLRGRRVRILQSRRPQRVLRRRVYRRRR